MSDIEAAPDVIAIDALPVAVRGVADAQRDGQYVGLPFVDRGRVGRERTGLSLGSDCWGLVKAFLEQEMAVADLPDYGGTPAVELIAVARNIEQAAESPAWVKIERRHGRRGDVVTMVGRERVDGMPRNVLCHVGVMVDRRRMLHVEEAADSAIVRLDHSSVRHRIAGFYRHRDLA